MIPFVVFCFFAFNYTKDVQKEKQKEKEMEIKKILDASDVHHRCPNCKAIIYTYNPCKNLWCSCKFFKMIYSIKTIYK